MRVLFHVTTPPSPCAARDAVLQDVDAIRALVAGDVMHLYPTRQPGTRIPRRLWGLQHALRLMSQDRRVDAHHVFNPDLYSFEVLRLLRKPIIYSVVAGVRPQHRAQAERLQQRARMIIVPAADDEARLRSWGIMNVAVAPPGIQVERFTCTPVEPHAEPTLLMGSAPWSEAQFHSKGVDALLEVARQRPQLRLIFLWRGVLEESMRRRIRDAGLQERVTVLTQQVDVNRVLAGAHASVALAGDEALIKAYPHSLLESLAAGKPVLISQIIPMARDVQAQGCGVVVDDINPLTVGAAVDELLVNYARYAAAARQATQRVPNQAQMALAYQNIYHTSVGGTA